jgi:uncharacterized damage-inducible protein DinB
MSGRSGIEALLALLDDAFRDRGAEPGDESQALLPNLATVPDDAWRALPAGAARSIESIAIHVGECKVMYDEYAFGPGSLEWGTPEVERFHEGSSDRAEVLAWLDAAHDRLVEHVAALPDDAELDRLRMTNWGELRPTRWIVGVMITHDAYHAGEINHLRSLLGTDDRWRHVQLGYA